MGRKILYWDKLHVLTMLTEVEAVINTRPLTYVNSDFPSVFTLTPAHFLAGGLDTIIPSMDICSGEDTEYLPQRDSAQELIDSWKRSRAQLDKFLEMWRRDYLLTLRETLPLTHKKTKSQILRHPKIGEIVIVKDDNLPHRAWKLAQIKDYIFSRDGHIRSAVIQLPSKNLVSRAINHLYPLEVPSFTDSQLDNTCNTTTNKNADDHDVTVNRRSSLRTASSDARKKIADQLTSEATTTVVFSFPGECHEGMAN